MQIITPNKIVNPKEETNPV